MVMETPTKWKRRLKWDVTNYKELLSVHCPVKQDKKVKMRLKSRREELYPVEIVERAEDKRVKVHYVRYKDVFEEWKDEDEFEELVQEVSSSSPAAKKSKLPVEVLEPFSLYIKLSFHIKRSLSCNRKGSSLIKIAMAFDALLFNGGLKAAERPHKIVKGVQHYKIQHYKDLNGLLGNNWHFQAISSNGNYGYVELSTVNFYIHKRRPTIQYMLNKESALVSEPINTGYCLTFSFVYNYGTIATFGKDKTVFYQ